MVRGRKKERERAAGRRERERGVRREGGREKGIKELEGGREK